MFRIQSGKALLLTLTLLGTGCASIPPESAELSVELGNRISQIETANMALLDQYFSYRKQQIDDFIEKQWIPVFTSHFYSNTQIERAWNTIVQENDVRQRKEFMIRTGSKLQLAIQQKRQSLMQPMDELHQALRQSIEDNYSQAKAINNSISSFLASASSLSESRNRYLSMLGVQQSEINSVIDKTDTTLDELLLSADKFEDKADAIEVYIEKIRQIRESF